MEDLGKGTGGGGSAKLPPRNPSFFELRYTTSLVARSLYTSGKSLSAAGLTATVAKEPETGEFCIELLAVARKRDSIELISPVNGDICLSLSNGSQVNGEPEDDPVYEIEQIKYSNNKASPSAKKKRSKLHPKLKKIYEC